MYFVRSLPLLAACSALVVAIPTPSTAEVDSRELEPRASSYWLANIKRQGSVAFGDSAFQIYRDVTAFGAKGDGITDDTAAINQAVAAGNRCGLGCDSSTVTPAIIYFPPGKYLVSKPIVQYYYTQFVGDAVSPPTLLAAPSFVGMAVVDSDPYGDGGVNWYTNQNNFYRQVRNFVIDLTHMPETAGAGIHWQVAQATSLQNIVVNMVKSATSKQIGIFMDNGSGGFMTDLTFNGGQYGAFFGNQQFTTRNMTCNGVQTCIFMNWNWVWTIKSLTANNCAVGLNMSTGGSNQTVGSVVLQDSTFVGTPIGVSTAFSKTGNVPATGGTLIIDNVDFSGSTNAVADISGTHAILAGGSKIASWGQGNAYTTGTNKLAKRQGGQIAIQNTLTAAPKPANLLTASGAIFERARPQYEHLAATSFLSVKAAGAKGDGVTDDTAAIQAVLNAATADQVVYFDHGAYLITSTVKVPKTARITGEIWPLIMASGAFFADVTNPRPVFQVGQPGDIGAVELSDLIFTTKGPAPGAILLQWNVGASTPGASGMWDVHARIGGSAGTGLQSDLCAKTPATVQPANPACVAAFLLLHVTATASIYAENNWFWVADHELDRADHGQINVFNGRGVLVESAPGPTWFYGTSVEHNQLYNYQLHKAQNVYMGAIQTETPYYQSNPSALTPFIPTPTFADPTFASCTTDACRKAWGLRIVASRGVLVSGAGLYSFFDNYAQTCLATESCQENMVSVEQCAGDVYLWGLSTKAATNMVSVDGAVAVKQADNRDGFCSTVAVFECV